MKLTGKASEAPPLTSEALANGAAFALEQAWNLLKDAVLLIQNHRNQSALTIATYCLEQIGRAEIYYERAQRTPFGAALPEVRSLKREIKDHLGKLYRANIAMAATLNLGAEPPAHGSPEEKALMGRLEQIRVLNEKAAPRKAVDARARALHVDRIGNFPGWNRPIHTIEPEDAEHYVAVAIVRYDLLRERVLRASDEASRRIQVWIESLPLLESPWDVFTFEEVPGGALSEVSAILTDRAKLTSS